MDEVTRKRHADNRNSLVQAIVALKDRWLHEDEGLDATRKAEMERHEEGLRAHDAMVSGDGGPVMDVATCEAELAAAQAKLDEAKRMAAEHGKPVEAAAWTDDPQMHAAAERASMGSAMDPDPDPRVRTRDEDAAWAARASMDQNPDLEAAQPRRGGQQMNQAAPGLLQMNQQGEQQVREDEDKRITAARIDADRAASERIAAANAAQVPPVA